MNNPIEFPEFLPDVRLQEQLSKAVAAYTKLKSNNKLWLGFTSVLGVCLAAAVFKIYLMRKKYVLLKPEENNEMLKSEKPKK